MTVVRQGTDSPTQGGVAKRRGEWHSQLLIPSEVSMGSVPPNAIAEGSFTIANRSPIVVRVDKILSSCGCTVVKQAAPVVKSGEIATVRFSLTTTHAATPTADRLIYVTLVPAGIPSPPAETFIVRLQYTVDPGLGVAIEPTHLDIQAGRGQRERHVGSITVTGGSAALSTLPSEITLSGSHVQEVFLGTARSGDVCQRKTVAIVLPSDWELRAPTARTQVVHFHWKYGSDVRTVQLFVAHQINRRIFPEPGIFVVTPIHEQDGGSIILSVHDDSVPEELHVLAVSPFGADGQMWTDSVLPEGSALCLNLTPAACQHLAKTHATLLDIRINDEDDIVNVAVPIAYRDH
jgi:hypothetical protein